MRTKARLHQQSWLLFHSDSFIVHCWSLVFVEHSYFLDSLCPRWSVETASVSWAPPVSTTQALLPGDGRSYKTCSKSWTRPNWLPQPLRSGERGTAVCVLSHCRCSVSPCSNSRRQNTTDVISLRWQLWTVCLPHVHTLQAATLISS